MTLTCNIDARGRRYRFWMGIILIVVGIALMILLRRFGWIGWTISAAVLIAGLFGLFEARMSWCAMRAMGFKTRI